MRRARPSFFMRGLNCGGGKCRGRTGEGGRGGTPNSGRFYPYPLLFWPQVISSFLAPSYFEFEAERPLFKSHMPSGALTVDDEVSLFCFVSFCSTAPIISGASKHIFSPLIELPHRIWPYGKYLDSITITFRCLPLFYIVHSPAWSVAPFLTTRLFITTAGVFKF